MERLAATTVVLYVPALPASVTPSKHLVHNWSSQHLSAVLCALPLR